MNIPPPDQEAIAKEWAMRHPGFIREDSDLLKKKEIVIMKPKTTVMTKRYVCAYCKKEFAYKGVYQKHLTRCTVQLNTIKPISEPTATKVQPSEFIDNRPIDDMAAKMSGPPEAPNAYAPSTAYDYAQTFGTPAKITEPRASFSMSRIYDYLVAFILLAFLVCGIIYAMLGIKLLAGI